MKKTREKEMAQADGSESRDAENTEGRDATTGDVGDGIRLSAEGAATEGLDPEAALRAEVAEWKDKFLRAKAEQQNASRRAAQQTQDSVRYANASLLRNLLDVADDFERSIAAASESDSVAAVLEGLRLVQQKLSKVMADAGAQRLDAEGEMFDPQKHEALMQQPSADHAAGTVIQQVQPGYTHHDRVLRPAKVVIAAAPPEVDENASEDSGD